MKLFFLSVLVACLLMRTAVAGLEAGIAAYESGNLPLAVQEFRESAEAGDADCQFNLALMYEQGIGVLKDEKTALGWYRKSAEQGNSNAQYNLAVLYENGRGTAADFAEANHWYRKAAVQGDGLAVGNLGMLYLRGQGVNPDKIAGVALLMLSATLDNSPENTARQNVAAVRGLTSRDIEAAQKLAGEMADAKNLLLPLDKYLQASAPAAAGK